MFITLILFIICSYFIMPTISSAIGLAVILSIFFGRIKILTDLLIIFHKERTDQIRKQSEQKTAEDKN